MRAVELNLISSTPCVEFWLELKKNNYEMMFTLLFLDYKMDTNTLQALLQQPWVRSETRNNFFQHILNVIGDRELLQQYTESVRSDETLRIECLEELIKQRKVIISSFLIDHKCHGPHLFTLQYCGYL